jgi:single-strand DNA-binding protein
MYLNKAMIYGNLTRDPEMKALPSGINVTTFSLATNRKFKDRDGKDQEQVEYHNVVVFGKQAESTAKCLSKGSATYVEGRLQTRSWDKDGQKQYRTEIVAERVQFGPKKGSDHTSQEQVNPQDGVDQPAQPSVPDYPEEEINPEDIPF